MNVSTVALKPDEVVRTLYGAFEMRDLGHVGALVTDDVRWDDTGSITHIVGREAFLSRLADEVRASGGSYALRLQRLYSSEDGHVVAFHEVTTSDGRVHTQCLLFEVADGRIGRVIGLAPAPSGPVFRR